MTLYSRLAAYYPCDDTHGRSLSEDVVGTNNGTAGVISTALGKIRQGMFFLLSGGQFRSVPNDSAIQALKGVCCWVKFSTLATDMSLVSKGSDGTDANTSLKLWYDHSDTDLAFTVGDGATSTTINTDGLTLAIDTWYHIRAYNDGNRMGIEVNGTLYASGTARAPLTETGLLYLGSDFSNNYLDGVLDEVALFSTSPTVADGAALYNGGSGASLPILDTLAGPSGRAGAGNRWLPPSYAESDDAVAYMAHGKLPVQRFDGALTSAGIEAPGVKPTVASSGSGTLTGQRYAYTRFLDSTGKVSNVSPISDVHETFGSAGADITGATNAAPIVITSASHGLTTGDTVRVSGQKGNTAANGTWTVRVISTDTFALEGSAGNGDWTTSAVPAMKVTVKKTGGPGVSQVQTLSYSATPTSGNFTLEFLGEKTTSISYDATAATIQAALELLTTIGAGNIVCAGGALNSADVTVTFQNALAITNHSLIEPDFTGATSTLAATVTTTGSSGNNETQEIDLIGGASGGTFTITYSGVTSGTIAYNASASNVDAALEAMSNIGSGDVTCSGGSLPGTAVSVEFTGALAKTNVPTMTINAASLTGGMDVAITTIATGAPSTPYNLSDASYLGTTTGFQNIDGNNDARTFVIGGRDGEFAFAICNAHLGGTVIIKFSLTVPRSIIGGMTDTGERFQLEEGIGIGGDYLCMDPQDGGFLMYIADRSEGTGHSYYMSEAWNLNTMYRQSGGQAADFTACVNRGGMNDAFYLQDSGWYGLAGETGIIAKYDNDGGENYVGDFSAYGRVRGFSFKHDGLKLYTSHADETVRQWTLAVAWRTNQATYDGIIFDHQEGAPAMGAGTLEIYYGANDEHSGTKFWIGTAYEYDFTEGVTVNEQQTITMHDTPSGGTFTLTYSGQTTGNIAYNATAATIDTALEALSNIAAGDVTCTGGPLPAAVTVEFTGSLAGGNRSEMTSDVTNITGTSVTSSHAETVTGVLGNNSVYHVIEAGSELGTHAGSPQEWQLAVSGTVSGGTFTISAGGTTSAAIAWDATGQEIADAVNTAAIADHPAGIGPGVYPKVGESHQTVAAGLVLIYEDGNNSTRTATLSSASLTGGGSYTLTDPAATSGLPNFAGYWSMTVDGETTTNLTSDAAASSVTSALEALSTVGSGNVTVTKLGGNIFADLTFYKVEFIGDLASELVVASVTNVNAISGWVGIELSGAGSAGTNEQQTIELTGSPVAGDFTISHGGQTTSKLDYNVSNADLIEALELLSTIGTGNVTVTAGGPLPAITTLTFAGDLHSQDVVLLTSDVNQLVAEIVTTVEGASGATNEKQRITVTGTPTDGDFTLTYSGQTTSAIAYNATAAVVETALEALSNIDNVTCTTGPLPGAVVNVEFIGSLAATDLDEMTADDGGLQAKVTTTTAGAKGVNELVSLAPDVPPGEGTFTLTFGGQTTEALRFDATAAQVQTQLAALSTIGEGNIGTTGGPIHSIAVVAEFKGVFSQQDVGDVTASSSMNQAFPVLNSTVTTSGLEGGNELQEVSVDAVTGGTFTLTYSTQISAAIAFDATASQVQQAFEAISAIGTGNALVTGGPLTEEALTFEFTGTLTETDAGLISAQTSALLNGGWATGANKITYTDVAIPTSTRITRRQVLRSKPGSAGVFYIDVDEEDVISNTFSSTKGDEELGSADAVVMLDANGVDSNLSRHTPPPSYKRVVASYQNRMFYGVNHVERSMVTVDGATATGIGTDWPNVFDGRTLYEDSGHGVAAVYADTQTAALSESTTAAQTAAATTITQAAPDDQRIYHSWVTSEDSYPESVHPGETFQVSRNSRDGEMTSEFVFDGKFYVGFKAGLYQYTFNSNPAPTPNGDGRMRLIVPRGVLNQRCIAFTDDLAVIMDREGVFMFDGNTLDPVSSPIKPVFAGSGTPAIQWKNQEWFHASYFSTQRTVRFFVTLDGGPYPRHALCFNVDQRFWWVEEYPWPITSSTVGVVDGQSVVFLGSTGRRVFTLDGTRDGLLPSVAGTVRGTATSTGGRTLTDSTAAFDAGLVGSVLTIVEGTGRGQQRLITTVSATMLTVSQHWGTRPSTDSVYQVAGVSWSVRTGKLSFTNNNQREVRRIEVFWEPTTAASQMDYQLYPDWSATAYVNKETRRAGSTDGVVTTKGSSYNKVDLTERGHVEQEFGGNRPEGVSGEKFIAVSAEGVTNDEQLRLLGLAVAGTE